MQLLAVIVKGEGKTLNKKKLHHKITLRRYRYCWSTIYGDDVRASCPQTCEECVSILRQPGAQIEVGGVAFELLPLGSEGEDAPANIGPADAAAAAGDATGGTPRTGGRSSSAFALVCLVTGAVVLVAVFALISWHARSKKNDFRYVQARLAQQMDQSTTDDFEWDGVLDDFMTVVCEQCPGVLYFVSHFPHPEVLVPFALVLSSFEICFRYLTLCCRVVSLALCCCAEHPPCRRWSTNVWPDRTLSRASAAI